MPEMLVGTNLLKVILVTCTLHNLKAKAHDTEIRTFLHAEVCPIAVVSFSAGATCKEKRNVCHVVRKKNVRIELPLQYQYSCERP